jgi:hypothetical protein
MAHSSNLFVNRSLVVWMLFDNDPPKCGWKTGAHVYLNFKPVAVLGFDLLLIKVICWDSFTSALHFTACSTFLAPAMQWNSGWSIVSVILTASVAFFDAASGPVYEHCISVSIFHWWNDLNLPVTPAENMAGYPVNNPLVKDCRQ